MSLVDMQPSESIRSKVVAVAARSTASRRGGVDDRVGRDDDEHRREGRGEHAGSLGHAADRPAVAVAPSPSSARVSVVMIASAATGPPSAARAAAAASTPPRSRSIGSRSPMRPVEQTTTSPAATPRSPATCSAVRWVSWKPGAPVQALAPPLLRTTASARPSATTVRDQVTGAASTRLLVKTAAAWWSGPSLTTRATSGRPEALRPAMTPDGAEAARGGDRHQLRPPVSVVGVMTKPARRQACAASAVPSDRDEDPVGVERGEPEDARCRRRRAGRGSRRRRRRRRTSSGPATSTARNGPSVRAPRGTTSVGQTTEVSSAVRVSEASGPALPVEGRVLVAPEPHDRDVLGVLHEVPRHGAHGATPATGSPVVSGSPRARLRHWTAAPAVPLVRLSTAATTTTRPTRSSRTTWRWTTLLTRGRSRCSASDPRAAGGRRARRRRRSPTRRAPRRRRHRRRRAQCTWRGCRAASVPASG